MAPLYRKKSLEKLSSPEELDRMVVIVSPMVWLSILAGMLLVVAFAIFLTRGRVYQTLSCTGLYFNRGAISSLYAPEGGQIFLKGNYHGEVFVEEGTPLFDLVNSRGKTTHFTAPTKGYYHLLVDDGSFVEKGAELYHTRQELSQDLQYMLCLVPFAGAEAVEVGAKAIFSPVGMAEQTYGHMTGTVTSIDVDVMHWEDLYQLLGNDTFVESLLGTENVVAVECEIDPDEESLNGFHWSGQKGSQIKMPHEMLFSVTLITAESSPLSLLLKDGVL